MELWRKLCVVEKVLTLIQNIQYYLPWFLLVPGKCLGKCFSYKLFTQTSSMLTCLFILRALLSYDLILLMLQKGHQDAKGAIILLHSKKNLQPIGKRSWRTNVLKNITYFIITCMSRCRYVSMCLWIGYWWRSEMGFRLLEL